MSENRQIAKSAGTIGFATLVSRILGFVRDCVIAGLFGTAQSAQAFVIAFTIPNMLRDLVGEGAANAAFVPVLSEYKNASKGKDDFQEVANLLFNIALIALLLISALGVIFAPFIIRIMAPGFVSQPEKLKETVMLARMMFPYVLLIGLTAYGMGVLNTLKHFIAPAFGPCLMNIAMITIPLLFSLKSRDSSAALAIAVLVGGVLQLSVQIPVLYKKGLRYKPRLALAHPAVKKIGALLLPRALASSAYQFNIIINRMCSSLTNIVGEGAPAALYYANRLFQFPLAIFGIALAQAALPTLSEQAHKGAILEFKKTVSFTLRLVFFISIPAALGLAILRVPIIQLLFQRGRFDAYSTRITASALFFYCFGIAFYAGNNVLASSFYSLKDTRAPLKAAVIALLLNIILNLALMRPFKIAGLSMATAISGALNFALLAFFLHKKIGLFLERSFAVDILKVLSASALMGAAVFILKGRFTGYFYQAGICVKGFLLAAVLAAGILVYLAAAYFLRIEQAAVLFKWLSKKR